MPVVEAARLCSVADPGVILAADVVRVMVGSRSDHAMVSVGEYALKGISVPVQAVSVGWERPEARLESDSQAIGFPEPLAVARRGPFSGRTAMAADLLDMWKAEEWRSLLVAGEPGIGKTRLGANSPIACTRPARRCCWGDATRTWRLASDRGRRP